MDINAVSCALYRQETIRRSRQNSCKPQINDVASEMILPRLIESKKSLLANLLSLIFLIAYALLGGFVFLYFEEEEYNKRKHKDLNDRYECVDGVIRAKPYDASTALQIIQKCLPIENQDHVQWNFLNSLLYGFGILTTLGYGKIETGTTYGKLFTVAYGFIGVPITVIILTNTGLYLRHIAKVIRLSCLHAWSNRRRSKIQTKNAIRLNESDDEEGQDRISFIFLILTVIGYLVFGAIVMPLLNGQFDFVNGLYYCYICFTAIEFGTLIPEKTAFIPIVIFYMVVGLAISTMAVELGALYVKKLYFYGRKASNFAAVKIWFGSKQLQVTELLSALSQTIGISPDTFSELDLEQLVKDAILVKEGKLDRIPQCYIFLEGIWPPSLVPLFMKSGSFPQYVDEDDKRSNSVRKKSLGFNTAKKLAYTAYLKNNEDPSDESKDPNNNAPLMKI